MNEFRFVRWKYGLLAVAVTVIQQLKAQTDPFAPYLNNIPPVVKTISETDSGAVTTTKFLFASRDKSNAVYAIMARPQQAGKHPAILFLHGGGSKAEDLFHLVRDYAQHGYITLAVDLPGICNAEKAVNSDGPWKKRPSGEAPRFDVSGGPQTSTLADAEIAGLEAFNFLRSQPDIDAAHIGITGFSWGGYSATMLSGLLGKKVKAAYAVFGCGYYEKGSFWKDIIAKMPEADRAVWLKYLDAGRRTARIKAAYFLEAASNDTYFWPEAVSATFQEIGKNANHVWNPNFNHNQSAHGPPMQRIYFDYYLKNTGRPFGKISIGKIKTETDGARKVYMQVQLPEGVQKDSVVLYYSQQQAAWQTRIWKPVPAATEGTGYVAVLPAGEVAQGLDFYAYLLDDRGVTTSSDMYQTKKNESINRQ